MFCKLCFDACKIDYEQHNLRDSCGKICCPYLLSIKCKNCGCNGHTVKYCKSSLVVNFHQSNKVSFNSEIKATRSNGSIRAPATLNSFYDLDLDLDLDFDLDIDEIVWGVGLKSMIGKSWADVV